MAEGEIKTAEEGWKQALSWGFFGAIIGGITGVLLSIFAIYSIGIRGILGTIVLGLGCAVIFFIAGIIVGFVNYRLPSGVKKTITILMVIAIIALLIWAVLTMWRSGSLPAYAKFASPVFEGLQKAFHGLAQYKYCLTADPKCPFFVSWEPTVQNTKEELSVSVSFDEKKVKPDDSINLLVKLDIKNPTMDELKIKPKCYLKSKDEKGTELQADRMGTYSYGDEFRIPLTNEGEEVHTQFYCYGSLPSEAENKNIYSEKVIVELERPVSVKTTWPVWIGTTPRKGTVRSSMSFNAPYIIGLASNNDMPFEEGKDYDFQIIIQKKADDADFKRLDSISVYIPEEMMAQCENFATTDNFLDIKDVSYDLLKNLTQYDEELDKFVFPCTLYISRATTEAVQAPIQLDAYYTVYSDYDTQIFKSP